MNTAAEETGCLGESGSEDVLTLSSPHTYVLVTYQGLVEAQKKAEPSFIRSVACNMNDMSKNTQASI